MWAFIGRITLSIIGLCALYSLEVFCYQDKLCSALTPHLHTFRLNNGNPHEIQFAVIKCIWNLDEESCVLRKWFERAIRRLCWAAHTADTVQMPKCSDKQSGVVIPPKWDLFWFAIRMVLCDKNMHITSYDKLSIRFKFASHARWWMW